MVQIAGLDDPDFTDRDSVLQQSMLQTKRNQMNRSEKYCILMSPRPETFEASGVGTTRGTSANVKELDPFLTDTQQPFYWNWSEDRKQPTMDWLPRLAFLEEQCLVRLLL